MNVQNKVIVITGGAGGIGSAQAKLLARNGAEVWILDLVQEKIDQLVEELKRQGGKAHGAVADVTSEEEWKTIVERIVSESGRLDVVVNNAGINIRKPIEEMVKDEWMKMMEVNTASVFLARTVALHSVPVLGVNLGSLGFMSELEVDELDRLRDLADWSFDVESRMMLDVSVLRGGKSVYNNIALNDAVISKGSIARVVRLNIFTEEGQLTKVGGDGIIASTPTGSTGYSMAAGGPIVEPTARNLLLTPICPHSTRSSSYVLSPEHVITVEAPDANRKFVYLSVDGGKAFSLKNNDQVRVSTSKYTTRLVRLSKKSFCEILDKKMGGEVTKA